MVKKNDSLFDEYKNDINSIISMMETHNHDSRYYTETEMDNKITSLTNLLITKSNVLSVSKISSTISLAIGVSEVNVSCIKSGLTPIGMVGFDNGTTRDVDIQKCILNGTTISFRYNNKYGSSFSTTFNFYILYSSI